MGVPTRLAILALSLMAGEVSGAREDMVVEYELRDGVTARATGIMGSTAAGWTRSRLYVSGDRTAEYTYGSLPGPGGPIEFIKKVYVATPDWTAAFEPGSGRGIKTIFGERRRREADVLVAGSQAAALIDRAVLLPRLGSPVGTRAIAGHACEFYRPDASLAKVELCIASIAGRQVLLWGRWYESDDVWMEEAVSVSTGADISDEVFAVPATVQVERER